MDEINVYLDGLSQATLDIAKKVRSWETNKVRIWISRAAWEACQNSDLKKQFCQGRSYKIVEENADVDRSLQYWEWASCQTATAISADNGLTAVIHRCRTQDISFVVFGGVTRTKGRLFAFVDAPQDNALPDSWISCSWFSRFEDLEAFCRKNGAWRFDLANTLRFAKTRGIVQGKPVYRELDTGRLLYEDNLHKTHYEVFDRHHVHLGEMSPDGELDRTKADHSRHYP